MQSLCLKRQNNEKYVPLNWNLFLFYVYHYSSISLPPFSVCHSQTTHRQIHTHTYAHTYSLSPFATSCISLPYCVVYIYLVEAKQSKAQAISLELHTRGENQNRNLKNFLADDITLGFHLSNFNHSKMKIMIRQTKTHAKIPFITEAVLKHVPLKHLKIRVKEKLSEIKLKRCNSHENNLGACTCAKDACTSSKCACTCAKNACTYDKGACIWENRACT